MKLAKILANPVKIRILQYLQTQKTATTKQLAESLDNISVPTLYRHINDLLKENVILVVQERKVRGSIERTFGLDEEKLVDAANRNIADNAYQFLMELYSQFQIYSQKETAQPIDDMLSLRTSYLYLTDEEFKELLQEIACTITKYQKYKLKDGRKARNLSFISDPVKESDDHEKNN